MQTVVFHCFAYTCCTASFQLFYGMSTIRYKVLNDRAFPQVCYRTLVDYKEEVDNYIEDAYEKEQNH